MTYLEQVPSRLFIKRSWTGEVGQDKLGGRHRGTLGNLEQDTDLRILVTASLVEN